MKQRAAVVLLALVGALVPLSAANAHGSHSHSTPALVVDDDGMATARNCNSSTATPYTTIQAAVDAAAVNGRIVVCPGVYAEDVEVNTAGLTIEGPSADRSHARRSGGLHGCGGSANDAVVNGTNATGAVRLLANKITWAGFVVSGNPNGPGLYTSPSASGYRVHSNTFEDNVFGVYPHSRGSFLSKFTDNCLADNNRAGASAGNGMYSDQGAQGIVISHNRLRDHDNGGILFANVSALPGPPLQNRLTISKNYSTNDFVFLRLWSTENATVEYNTVEALPNTGSAIRIGTDNNVILVRRNDIRSAGFNGIAVRDQTDDGFGTAPPTNVKIIDNHVRNAFDSGIEVTADGKTTTVIGNHVKNSGANGIFFGSTTAGNLIAKNVALNNGDAATEFDCRDDSGPGGLGTADTDNFWKKNVGATDSPDGLCRRPW